MQQRQRLYAYLHQTEKHIEFKKFFNTTKIEQSSCKKLLGVTVDKHFTFRSHINNILFN